MPTGRSTARPMLRLIARRAAAWGLGGLLAMGGLWADAGSDGRRAFAAASTAAPGPLTWHQVADGFETANLAAIVAGQPVEHVLLARVDPARFRFEVRTAPAGDKRLADWMVMPGAAMVMNGSYYAPDGQPDTPVLSHGRPLGPKRYDATSGAFIAGPSFTGVLDLAHVDWAAAFVGAEDAMVSYPLLLADGMVRVSLSSGRLANRSFVGQDAAGRIITGTTAGAYFPLDRFAAFLLAAPLGLTLALNLDGGPLASQGIALNGFERRVDRGVPLPIVLAVFPR